MEVTSAAGESQRLLTGAAWGTAAAALAAGWWVATRFSASQTLDQCDLAALRFGISGLLLAPVLLRHWGAIRKVPWPVLATMAIGAGAPYAVVTGGGLRFAPAGNAGALATGLLPLFAALLSVVIAKEPVDSRRRLGLGIVVAGTAAICGQGMMAGSGPGYPLLATGALLWAGFTIAMRRSGLPALQAVAVVSVASLVLYLPVYALLLEPRVLQASLSELLVQATYQGILAGFLAVYCYGRAVALLGAARGAAFLALVPVLATVMAVPLLGERPGPAELIGVALVSLGVCLASGVRLIRPLALLARSPRHAATVGLGAARLT